MANPTTIDLAARFLNADTLRWNAWSLRHEHDVAPGEGVAGYESFRVMQRQAGANMSVDIGSSSAGLMTAWVRGDTRGGQGLYEVDNILRSAPTASTYQSQINVDVSTNGVASPRLDQVILEVLDAQHTGASSTAQIRVVAGTPTGGATLDNRTGAAALPSSALLLADILVPASESTSIDTADIRDRRAYPLRGVIPARTTAVDMVMFEPPPVLIGPRFAGDTDVIFAHDTQDTFQSACLMFLPRRIVGATRIRWKYAQHSTAVTGDYRIAICDASARKIVETGLTSFTGAANTWQVRSETISATTFDAGWYYVYIGYNSGTASSAAYFKGVDLVLAAASGVGCPFPNVAYYVNSGGTTLADYIPTSMTDISTLTAATSCAPVPIVALSVG